MQLLAESKGLISHPYAQCFMGHGGDIEAAYTLRKKELPKEILEDMRVAYGRVSDLLMTMRKPTISLNELDITVRKRIMEFENFTEEDIAKLDRPLDEYSMSEIKQIIDKKNNGTNVVGQKVILRKELKEHITKGFKFEDWINNTGSPEDEAIVSVQAHN